MRVAVVGAGFVGVATALYFCDAGRHVTLVERDESRHRLLLEGRAPFHEPGVNVRLRRDLSSGRLRIAQVLPRDVPFSVYVVCVGTPARPSGAVDLRQVRRAASQVGRHLVRHPNQPLVLVKSTVPPGTLAKEVVPRIELASRRREGHGFFAVSNPEFLREGSALRDTLHPDRLVIGTLNAKALHRASALFRGLKCPLVATDPATAELIKYASNAFLAVKISYANEIARLSGALGLDVYEVMRGVGADPRIGPLFLRAGIGFGGHCLPKDTMALARLARRTGRPSLLLEASLEVNRTQVEYVVDLAERALGSLRRRKVALLGLAFKPQTSDVRGTQALPLYRELLRRGARVVVWDPRAAPAFAALLSQPPRVAATLRDALRGADAAIIHTEWPQLRRLQAAQLRRWMRRALIIDGRRTLDPLALERGGVRYYGVGWRREPHGPD